MSCHHRFATTTKMNRFSRCFHNNMVSFFVFFATLLLFWPSVITKATATLSETENNLSLLNNNKKKQPQLLDDERHVRLLRNSHDEDDRRNLHQLVVPRQQHQLQQQQQPHHRELTNDLSSSINPDVEFGKSLDRQVEIVVMTVIVIFFAAVVACTLRRYLFCWGTGPDYDGLDEYDTTGDDYDGMMSPQPYGFSLCGIHFCPRQRKRRRQHRRGPKQPVLRGAGDGGPHWQSVETTNVSTRTTPNACDSNYTNNNSNSSSNTTTTASRILQTMAQYYNTNDANNNKSGGGNYTTSTPMLQQIMSIHHNFSSSNNNSGGGSTLGGLSNNSPHYYHNPVFQATYQQMKQRIEQNCENLGAPTSGTYTCMYYDTTSGSGQITYFSATQLHFEPIVVQQQQQPPASYSNATTTPSSFCWRVLGQGNDPDGRFMIVEGMAAANGDIYWIEQPQTTSSAFDPNQTHHPRAAAAAANPYSTAVVSPQRLLLHCGKINFQDDSFTGFWMSNNAAATTTTLSVSSSVQQQQQQQQQRHFYEMRLHLPYDVALQKATVSVLQNEPSTTTTAVTTGARNSRNTAIIENWEYQQSHPSSKGGGAGLFFPRGGGPTNGGNTLLPILMQQPQHQQHPNLLLFAPTNGTYRCSYYEKGIQHWITMQLQFVLEQLETPPPPPPPPQQQQPPTVMTILNNSGIGQELFPSSTDTNQNRFQWVWRVSGEGHISPTQYFSPSRFIITDGMVSSSTGRAFWIEQHYPSHTTSKMTTTTSTTGKAAATAPKLAASSSNVDPNQEEKEEVQAVEDYEKEGNIETNEQEQQQQQQNPTKKESEKQRLVLSTGSFSFYAQDFVGWRQVNNDSPSERYQEFFLVQENQNDDDDDEGTKEKENDGYDLTDDEGDDDDTTVEDEVLRGGGRAYRVSYELARSNVLYDIQTSSMASSTGFAVYYSNYSNNRRYYTPMSGTYTFSYYKIPNNNKQHNNNNNLKKQLVSSTVQLHFELLPVGGGGGPPVNKVIGGGDDGGTTTTDHDDPNPSPAPVQGGNNKKDGEDDNSFPPESQKRWKITGSGKNAWDGSQFAILEGLVSASGKAYWVQKTIRHPNHNNSKNNANAIHHANQAAAAAEALTAAAAVVTASPEPPTPSPLDHPNNNGANDDTNRRSHNLTTIEFQNDHNNNKNKTKTTKEPVDGRDLVLSTGEFVFVPPPTSTPNRLQRQEPIMEFRGGWHDGVGHKRWYHQFYLTSQSWWYIPSGGGGNNNNNNNHGQGGTNP